MKQSFLRRLGALVLSLALALPAAAAPAWAAPAAPPAAVTGVSLNKAALTLTEGDSETLSATVAPANAANKAVTWSSSNPAVAAVDAAAGTVTAVKEGSADITATTVDGGRTAVCRVTVNKRPVPATGVSITVPSAEEIRIDKRDEPTMFLAAATQPSDSTDVVTWKSSDEKVAKVEVNPDVSGGRGAILTHLGAGVTTIVARAGVHEAELKVTVSGLSISRTSMTLTEGSTGVLAVEGFGEAASATSRVEWTSSDNSVASVRGGTIYALKPGAVTITAAKDMGSGIEYTVTCAVTVTEDRSAIVGPVEPPADQYLVLSQLYGELDRISRERTKILDANGNVTFPGYGMAYITNLSVTPVQGVLYYNYDSEANTGDGIGIADRFYQDGSAYMGQMSLSNVTFVPNRSFTGTAEISYTVWNTNGGSFSGVIRVNVKGTGAAEGIRYSGTVGSAVGFLADDFNAYCRSRTGRNLNYVTFTLPQSGLGILYYRYNGSASSSRVSAAARYNRAGGMSIGEVSFVPASVGTVKISYRAVDTSGSIFTGQVIITVTAGNSVGAASDVFLAAQRGQPVTFSANDFYQACVGTIGEQLSYVRFGLPSYDQGTLYYNYRGSGSYDSRVDSASRYYYSGVPGIGGVTFVPAEKFAGQAAIPYTGYGESGSTYTGTVRIGLAAADQGTIGYTAPKDGLVAFKVSDFNDICLRQTGASMDYVYFPNPPSSGTGVLYYNYSYNLIYNTQVYPNIQYYRTAMNVYQNLLGNVAFLAGDATGSVTIPFYGSSVDGRRFEGSVVIQVASPAPTEITLSGSSATQLWLSSSALRGACNAVVKTELSYIEITGLPDASQGRLYAGRSGYGTGTQVKVGDRYYWSGSPGIDQLSFVPRGGSEGTSEISYTGVSITGEQVSGTIRVVITKSGASRYFNDMGGSYAWAADSVDFLYTRGIDGVGGGRYGPSAHIRRGDFVLMLCRALNLNSGGVYSFYDVPAGSYYSQAIATAKQLGIVTGRGEGGNYFYPAEDLTREDAMVMICNALKASGQTLTNGLAADLSRYPDRDDISAEAREAVGILTQLGVIEGDGSGRLRPQGTINRAEAAKLLHHVMTL